MRPRRRWFRIVLLLGIVGGVAGAVVQRHALLLKMAALRPATAYLSFHHGVSGPPFCFVKIRNGRAYVASSLRGLASAPGVPASRRVRRYEFGVSDGPQRHEKTPVEEEVWAFRSLPLPSTFPGTRAEVDLEYHRSLLVDESPLEPTPFGSVVSVMTRLTVPDDAGTLWNYTFIPLSQRAQAALPGGAEEFPTPADTRPLALSLHLYPESTAVVARADCDAEWRPMEWMRRPAGGLAQVRYEVREEGGAVVYRVQADEPRPQHLPLTRPGRYRLTAMLVAPVLRPAPRAEATFTLARGPRGPRLERVIGAEVWPPHFWPG